MLAVTFGRDEMETLLTCANELPSRSSPAGRVGFRAGGSPFWPPLAREGSRTTGHVARSTGSDGTRSSATARVLRRHRRKFTIPLDLRGTDFQKGCWQELLRIPYGETRSYAEIARAVGRPNAYRAVGQANHYNPIAIVVPCHRVLAAGTALGGYGGGLATKAFLLRLEGAAFRDDATSDTRQEALKFT